MFKPSMITKTVPLGLLLSRPMHPRGWDKTLIKEKHKNRPWLRKKKGRS